MTQKFARGETLTVDAEADALYGEHENDDGELVPHKSDGTDGEEWVSVKGQDVHVVGDSWESTSGDNKGERVVPVRLPESKGGALLGIPEGRLTRRKATRTSFGGFIGKRARDAYDRIFRNKN